MTDAILAVDGRPFTSDISAEALDAIQTGVMRTVYRGVPFLKSPFDIGIYLQLMSSLRPRTVIEIGTKHGGSALWFADMMDAHGIEDGSVISVDIKPIAKFTDPRISFLAGDANDLGKILPEDLLSSLSRPWLVIEDSSHFYQETMATLDFFRPHLKSGDYIVVEDGVVSQFPGDKYAVYDAGPNRAVTDFLALHGSEFSLDAALCDHYGRNATYNPNGWLRRR